MDTSFINQITYLVIFFRRNLLPFMIFTIAGMAVAGYLSLSMDQKYKGAVVAKIGRVGSVRVIIPEKKEHGGEIRDLQGVYYRGIRARYRLLTSTEELYRWLAIEYDVRRARMGLTDTPYLGEINTYGDDAIEIFVIGETVSEVEDFSKEIIDRIVTHHNELYESLIDSNRIIEDALTKNLSLLEQQTRERTSSVNDSKARQLSDSTDEVTILHEIRLASSPMYSSPTVQVGDVRVHKVPQKSFFLYLMFGCISGFSLGLLMTSVIDAVKVIRRINLVEE